MIVVAEQDVPANSGDWSQSRRGGVSPMLHRERRRKERRASQTDGALQPIIEHAIVRTDRNLALLIHRPFVAASSSGSFLALAGQNDPLGRTIVAINVCLKASGAVPGLPAFRPDARRSSAHSFIDDAGP